MDKSKPINTETICTPAVANELLELKKDYEQGGNILGPFKDEEANEFLRKHMRDE